LEEKRVMPIKRYKPEQIVTMLRQIEVSMANGKTTPQACKEAEITIQTFYRWRKEYGGLKMDLLRVQARGLISSASKSNPFCDQILAAIPANKASVALGWRQFLYWFADVEHRIETGGASPEDLVKLADENWAAIEKSKPPIYMEERPNNGDWVREWLRALVEFPYS
jgi:hypothetical protein